MEGHPRHLNLCKVRKGYNNAGNVDFMESNIAGPIPLNNNSVDIIYCSEVIEHMPSPESFLSEIRRVLKSNGYLFFTTPNEPNVFQKPYWLSSHRQKLIKRIEEERNNPEICIVNNKKVPVYGHISCKAVSEWENILDEFGFRLVDFRRGAIVYGGSKFHDTPIVLGLRMLLEAFLDAMPRSVTRRFSLQVIGLYQIVK